MNFKGLLTVMSTMLIFALLFMPLQAFAERGEGAEDKNVEFAIELLGSEYDPARDVSIWRYRVAGTGEGYDLSHWVLNLCEGIEVLGASHRYELKTRPDPTTGLTGIKFDTSIRVDETVDYWIKVKGNWESEDIVAAVKGGPGFKKLDVMGPSCEKAEGIAEANDDVDQDKDIDRDTDSGRSENDENRGATVDNQKSVKTKVHISQQMVSGKLVIHAMVKVKVKVKIEGTWHLNIGGKIITVDGSDTLKYVVKDAPAGTYLISAKFVPDNGGEIAESESMLVTMSTEEGGTLPNTATPWYNMLMVGVILSAIGFIAYRWFWKGRI
jgi:hypothetical protein